ARISLRSDQRSLFLDECCLYSLKLLTIQVSSDGLTPFQKPIMDNSSCWPPNTQQNLVWVQGSLARGTESVGDNRSCERLEFE
ncbi:unnamed protein product, partial [Acanthoscelides obtectus]